MVLLQRPLVAEPGHKDGTAAHTPEQAMQNPQPFIVIQNGALLFIIHAYSARQARAIVAARLSDTAGVTVVAVKGASR